MRRTVVLAVATAALVAFGLGLALRPVARSARPQPEVAQVRAQLASLYYRVLPQQVLRKPTVAALLAALHDRYTTYLSPSEYRTEQRTIAGGYGGVGLFVLPAPRGLLVRRTMVGPARVAGVRPGDTIMAVDGLSTAALSFHEAMGRILGIPGSRVTLRILRDGRPLRFDLVRRTFAVHPVHARLEHGVGVLRLDAFSRSTAGASAAALARLTRQGAKSLVLDLRGNPGGLLDQAVGVASLFLPKGSSIVSLAGAHRPLRILYARGGAGSTLPLAVLVDGASASASEVVAGALKDHGRATVIGEATYGKSLVQEIVQLPSGAALKLTVARYLTPAGIDISRNGVRPDIPSRHALDAAIRLFTAGRRS
ncbi:MAG: carboxyl-terminal processing protease [Gaiellaceae bacterium]|nr:carboxyl-terminal processing protease [Gaiellaceae bacterium]